MGRMNSDYLMMETLRPDQVYYFDNDYVLADLSETYQDIGSS